MNLRAACCVLAAAMSCPAQPVVENAFSLDVLSPRLPTLIYPPGYNFDCPPPFDPWIPRCRGPADLALTVGDLNNDGVPDLVVSNELALLWVYFLQRDPVTGDLSVDTSIPIQRIFDYPGNPGQGAVRPEGPDGPTVRPGYMGDTRAGRHADRTDRWARARRPDLAEFIESYRQPTPAEAADRVGLAIDLAAEEIGSPSGRGGAAPPQGEGPGYVGGRCGRRAWL